MMETDVALVSDAADGLDSGLAPVRRRSEISGKVRDMMFPGIQAKRVMRWLRTPADVRPLVQYEFPYLSDDDREFIVSGVTPEEWDGLFGDGGDG